VCVRAPAHVWCVCVKEEEVETHKKKSRKKSVQPTTRRRISKIVENRE